MTTATQAPLIEDTLPRSSETTRKARSKGEQIRDILFECGRTALREVAQTLQAEAPHELAILLDELGVPEIEG